MITVSGLTKQFGKFTAIKDVSFTIEEGTIVGFVGKNGAGKTTTIRCMLDLLKPTKGTIRINNRDSIKESHIIKQVLGYMPSDTDFYEGLTCEEVFRFACSLTCTDYEKAETLSNYFELDLKKNVKDLSIGNKKKVAIIFALLKDIKILILDEPTSGLDPLMQMKFFELMLELRKKGVTIFLSSHNLMEIQKYCDRVIIIKDGIIADDLKMNQILPTLKQIVCYKTKDGKEKQFENNEDINSLIQRLSKLDLEYLEIKYASVEEEFIKYYKE